VKHSELTDEAMDLIAERFKALSDPMRLRILNTLRDGELIVGDLAAELDASHANISKHLQQLHSTGFVKRRKEGLHVYSALADRSVMRLCDIMCSRIDDELVHHRRKLGR
jgi:DNA-binding transcriptional ArsR family regulator